jgi:hypothetical protein
MKTGSNVRWGGQVDLRPGKVAAELDLAAVDEGGDHGHELVIACSELVNGLNQVEKRGFSSCSHGGFSLRVALLLREDAEKRKLIAGTV